MERCQVAWLTEGFVSRRGRVPPSLSHRALSPARSPCSAHGWALGYRVACGGGEVAGAKLATTLGTPTQPVSSPF